MSKSACSDQENRGEGLACPSRAIQGLDSVHRQRGYGCGLATGRYVRSRGNRGNPRSLEASFFIHFLLLPYLALPSFHSVSNKYYRRFIAYLIDQKENRAISEIAVVYLLLPRDAPFLVPDMGASESNPVQSNPIQMRCIGIVNLSICQSGEPVPGW